MFPAEAGGVAAGRQREESILPPLFMLHDVASACVKALLFIYLFVFWTLPSRFVRTEPVLELWFGPQLGDLKSRWYTAFNQADGEEEGRGAFAFY